MYTKPLIAPRLRVPLLTLLIFLFVALPIAWFAIRRYAEPIARAEIIEWLERKLRCNVELDSVHLSFAHGLEVHGTGLRIMAIGSRQRITPGGTPMLVVRTFQFSSTLSDLIFHHASAITAYAQGLVLTIPAGPDSQHLDQSNPDPAKRNKPRDSFFLNRLICTDSTLVLERTDHKNPPIVFDFNKFILIDPGGPKNDQSAKPFLFEAILAVPVPHGEVHATGHIGPWVFLSSRTSPVDANYTYSHADLSDVKGLEGTLSSSGHIGGQLGAITVHGTTETPDFALDVSAHSFPVHTEFQALVDGTDGNFALQSVTAHFLHTTITANGLISKSTSAVPGHNIALDIRIPNGRTEDLLTLFSHTQPPLLNAPINITGHIDVPPGKQRLILKFVTRGSATITGATFSNPDIQQKVDAFSLRAQDIGAAKQAIKDPASAPLVTSRMTGPFTIRDGAIQIPNLVYTLPGADALVSGTYPIVGRDLDFHGVVQTRASASHMETGIKSLLLKPISPFLKKNGAGMQLPLAFTGDKSHPKFTLDLHNRQSDATRAATQKTPKASQPH